MNRPYSLNELKDIEKELHIRYRLSEIFAFHSSCNHRYRVKKGGRKEQNLLNANSNDVKEKIINEQYDKQTLNSSVNQTCSICFKLRVSLEIPNKNVIENVMKNDGKILDIKLLHDKEIFYKWLFQHDYN